MTKQQKQKQQKQAPRSPRVIADRELTQIAGGDPEPSPWHELSRVHGVT